MQDKFSITRRDTGDNLITIDIKLNQDGGMTVQDWCCGSAAETFYGHDDVETYFSVGRDTAGELYQALTGRAAKEPARDLAVFLQSTKSGNTRIMSWLKGKCDELGIEYEWYIWP